MPLCCENIFAPLLPRPDKPEGVDDLARRAPVFDIRVYRTEVGKVVSRTGKAAGIVTNPETGKPATAQDDRRSFGTRWAKPVKTAVLKRLMRHKDIKTTPGYHVDQVAEDAAGVIWEAYRKAAPKGKSLGNTPLQTSRKTGGPRLSWIADPLGRLHPAFRRTPAGRVVTIDGRLIR